MEEYFEELGKFLQDHSTLYNFFRYDDEYKVIGEDKVIHYFLQDDWTRHLPASFRTELSQCSLGNCMKMSMMKNLDSLQKDYSHLFAYLQQCKALYPKISLYSTFEQKVSSKEEIHMMNFLFRGASPKKQYEMKKLGQFVLEKVREWNIDTIVDIGSGKGYITSYLAFFLRNENVEIVGIDCNQLHTQGAIDRWSKLEENWQTLLETPPKNVTAHLGLDINQEQFLSLLKPHLMQTKENRRIMMLSLHACGDLSPTMLKLFLQTDAVALVNVPCCYNLLTEDICLHPKCKLQKEAETFVGYPLSTKGKETHLPLSTGKFLACDLRPEVRSEERLLYEAKMHSYRAVLECYLYDKFTEPIYKKCKKEIKLETHMTGAIPEAYTKTFSTYAKFALQKMKTKVKSDHFKASPWYKEEFSKALNEFLETKSKSDLDKELDEYYSKFKPNEGSNCIEDVFGFGMIRSMLGPLFEVFILLDRKFWLQQELKESYVELIQLFEPKYSTRGYAMVACKQK